MLIPRGFQPWPIGLPSAVGLRASGPGTNTAADGGIWGVNHSSYNVPPLKETHPKKEATNKHGLTLRILSTYSPTFIQFIQHDKQ